LPRAVKAPKAIDEASIGGRGLMLVRKMAKAMQYRRSDGRNRLRIALSLR
jgi:anti-sigma regulatory factor (Ser/Thr protein kinase)